MARTTGGDFQTVPIVDEGARLGPVTRLIIFTIVLLGAAVFFALFHDWLGDQFLLGLLGVLAMIGTGFLFAAAIGFIHIAPSSAADELAKAFVDSMSQGLVITDQKGRIVYANAAYAQMTGATSAADIRTLEAILSENSEASGTLVRLGNALRDGEPAEGEFRLSQPILPDKEQGPRWYRARARAFVLPGHRRPFHAWQIADISAERAEQERYFLDLQKAIDHLDHAPAGFFSADPEGRVTYLNATLAEWLGVDLANFTPGSLRLSEIVAGDGMALIHAVKADPGSSRDVVIDLDLATRKGEALPVRFMQRVSANREGAAGPSRTIVLNRSHGADASAEQDGSEVRFTRFFNSTPMAIAGVDSDGRILRTNAPFLSLFASVVDRDAVDRGLKLENVINQRERAAFATALERARQRQANIAPIDTTLPDNEERHMRFYVNAIADEAGEGEEAAIVYAVETTEQKALEAQMAQSQKMQAVGQLAGGIAHDFNNVLTAIIMASDLLLTNHRPSDPSFQDIMNIKQNANRAASLVRQLLAFSRRQTMRPEVLNLTDVLADLRMLLSRLVGNDIKLNIEHGRDLWPVRADIGQFEQVIVNLAVNARDAMPEGGDLTIRTRNVKEDECESFDHRELARGEYVLVEVEDTGTGIDPDVIRKVFEPFFTTKEVGKGTGLGLSMVYGIIKQTGGFIFCDSELGKGSVFRIFLPRDVPAAKPVPEAGTAEGEGAETEASRAQRKPASEEHKDLSGSATVLLVEDEDAVRMGNVRALASRGYTVHEASSGVEALEVFKELEGKVDIVVSDVVMPEMDGPTLLIELRKLQPDIRFIFVSGYAEDAFAKSLPDDAKFGFLAKPFSLKQLATTVKDMLERDNA
jgi:two-component system cell cycle sensor histidine kinase/response regulator CckA